MALKYGIDFPFSDSQKGDFLKMTDTSEKEIRANLIHLLLTRKGSRYYLPDFGTRLYEYIFNQNDTTTFELIEDDIRDNVSKYIPNLDITSLKIIPATDDPYEIKTVSDEEDERLFRTTSQSARPYTAKVKLEYQINNGSFSSSDFVIINI